LLEKALFGITATRKRECELILKFERFDFISVLFFSFTSDWKLRGVFPKSYIHLIDHVELVNNEYKIKRSDIVEEITTILKEWHEHFKRFFLVRAFTQLKNK
jgi:hypothetical protein